MNQKLSVLFVIKLNKKNQKGFCPLNVRITFNKKRKPFSTGLFVHPAYWNAKKQVIISKEPNTEYINAQILLIQQKINKAYLSLQLKNADYTINDIYECYLGKVIKREDTVVHYFRSYLIYLSKLIGKDIKEATYKKSKYVCDDIEAFIKHKYNKKDISLKSLKLQFLDGNVIAEYNSVAEVSRQAGISKTCISRVCRGERENSGGYCWEYK